MLKKPTPTLYLYLLLISSLLILQSVQQTCLASQYFNGQRCAPCQQNCICSQQNTCSSCMPGYTYDSKYQNCLACPVATNAVNVGCAQCCYQIVNTAFVCSSCPALSNTYLLGGQCVRIAGCSSVSSDGLCYSCASGYFLKDGTCIACHASCTTCTDSTFCASCNVGYYNATNSNYGTCAQCSVGCQTCTSLTACTLCGTGFRLSTGLCVACGLNCLQCTNSACTSCAIGYALIGGSCVSCTTAANGGSAGCTACSVTTGSIICSQCSSSFYLSLTGACVSCPSAYPNSVLCKLSRPLQCLNDFVPVLASRYYLISNQCIANTNRCKVMANIYGQCSSCYFQSGSYYKLTNGVCTQCVQSGCATFNTNCQCQSCQNGYQYVNKQCVACQNLNCFICQSNIRSCQVCAPNYGLISSACIQCTQTMCLNCDGDSTKCNTCQVGYYNNGGICYKCQLSCQSCVSSTLCTACNAGNYLLSTGRCKSLPSNCVQVSSTTGSCTKCNYGYQIEEGICVPCSTDLFNMKQCQRFCPSYYALMKWQGIFGISKWILVILMSILGLNIGFL